ncbi:thymidylate kinase [Pontibacter mucosus]|uniref:Thymidylate kinase n=1 Tax=Pontibacter mucosus TaxID=1649266 RepID=A0A2T5YE50_9BACT|nr:hypothetical protein [Pontibacter mucosus]PTX14983.1 thymidylate kinase [Pontibacter mucosus]
MLAAHLTQGLQLSTYLLERLQQKKIKFAHWKGNVHLLESLEGKTDIELLLRPEDREDFEATMAELNFKKAESAPWNKYPQVEDWLGFDEETGALLHLHTHYALIIPTSYGDYVPLPWTEQFFKHLTTDEATGWPIPETAMEALILLVRLQIKGQNPENILHDVHLEKKQELLVLLSKTDAERFAACCAELRLRAPVDLADRISHILAKERLGDIIALSDFIYRQLPASIKSAASRRSPRALYYEYFLKTLKHYKPLIKPVRLKKRVETGGRVIALVGSDGSGKSTLSQDITSWLTYKIDTHYFYMGKLPFIKSYQTRLFSYTDLLASRNLLARVTRKLLGDLYHILIIRQKASMLKQARELSDGGSIAICDRYPQQEVFGFNDGPRLQGNPHSMLARLEMKYFDQALQTGADIIFRLIVSPETAHQRKPEHHYEDIRRKCESITSISFSANTPATVIDIDANAPYEEVLLQLKRHIWQRL